MLKFAAIAALGLALGGCSTVFHDTAESPRAGWVYVSGQHNAAPALWLCPTAGGDCEPVRVTEIER